MWYAILSEDVEDSGPLRASARAGHLARFDELLAQGRVLVAGSHPAIDALEPGAAGISGSLVIVDFPSLQDAEAWAAADPYLEAGVYRKSVVKPFKQVLP